MASICSMISFIVLLLATYSSSAPLVPELQNATSDPQVENATGVFHFDKLTVLVRREAAEERAVNDTVGLSSSSSEDDTDKTVQTTEKLALREMEEPSLSQDNVEREIDAESLDENERSFTEENFTTEMNHKREADAESLDENERSFTEENFTTEMNHKREADAESLDENERSFTEESFTTEMNHKREADAESLDENERSFTEENFAAEVNTKRAIGVQSFESSTAEETSVAPSSEVKKVKRGSGGGSWLSADSDEKVQKRSIEDSSVPSTSEVINAPRTLEQPSSLSDEASQEFNRRAIGSVELNESSTIIAETIQFDSTTYEQPSTSIEAIREEVSSTVESESTVTPVDDFTRPSPVPSESKSKILAIIPGQISKSQLVINPATGKTAGFRPVHQIQLSQGQNQTIVEDKKPNY